MILYTGTDVLDHPGITFTPLTLASPYYTQP